MLLISFRPRVRNLCDILFLLQLKHPPICGQLQQQGVSSSAHSHRVETFHISDLSMSLQKCLSRYLAFNQSLYSTLTNSCIGVSLIIPVKPWKKLLHLPYLCAKLYFLKHPFSIRTVICDLHRHSHALVFSLSQRQRSLGDFVNSQQVFILYSVLSYPLGISFSLKELSY